MKDLRSPLAKARDKWLENERGKECINPVGIGVLESNRMYLRNRIEIAFIAGWNAKEELEKEEITHQILEDLDLEREV